MKKAALFFFILLPILTSIDAQVKDGDLIRGSKENIYLVSEGKACWIPSKEIFDALKFDWNTVKLIDDAKLNKMPKGFLSFVNTSGNYFFCINGKKAFIGDLNFFKALGLNEKSALNLPDAELNKLSGIPFLIKGKAASKYLVMNGKICQISSDKTFKALGLDPATVNTISDKALAGLTKSPLLIKGTGEKVFLIEKDKKRWVASQDVFKAKNYDWKTIYKVDEKILTAIPDGVPVK